MKVALVVVMLATMALAGCTTTDDTRATPDVIRAVQNTVATRWDVGDHWAYQATFHRNATYDIALVVHEAKDGFRVGSNVSSGFFGLPFSGNVTKDLNPVIRGEEWPMYRFPLDDGKTWSYSLFGYDATTTAYAALVDVPGQGKVPGYRLEASTLGQVFARYDYSAQAGWFTRLELIEPSKREQLLDVRLVSFGDDYGRPYFIERVLDVVRIDYPAVPGSVPIEVPPGYSRIRATLTVESAAGAIDAKLESGGRAFAEARAVGKGVATDQTSMRPGVWTLSHAGAGKGTVYLEIVGVTASGGSATWRETPRLML